MKKKLTIIYLIMVRFVADAPIFWMIYFLYRPKEGTGGPESVLFNLALFGGFAVFHSILTRKFAKDIIAKIAGEEYVRSIYVLSSGITLSLVLFFWQPVSGELWRASGVSYWVISAIFFLMFFIVAITMFFIDYPDFLGIGSIWRRMKNLPPQEHIFSLKGLYAFTRHPMYLFLILTFWITPVMNFSRLEFAILGTIYFIIGTFHEEKNLREELGEVYELYQKNVPMWIPRLSPWKNDKTTV